MGNPQVCCREYTPKLTYTRTAADTYGLVVVFKCNLLLHIEYWMYVNVHTEPMCTPPDTHTDAETIISALERFTHIISLNLVPRRLDRSGSNVGILCSSTHLFFCFSFVFTSENNSFINQKNNQ